jgi:hypothetical protein
MAENNEGYQQNRVSTAGITLFDDNSTMLRLSYLGDTLSLLIGYPKANDNGKNSYPEDQRHTFLITADRAAALYHEIIVKELTPALENKQDFCKGIFLNRGKTAIMELRIQDGEVYLVYCKDINEDRVSENSYVFHFQKTDTITNYDPSGTFDSQGTVEGSFFLFCKYLESGVYEMPNAGAHAFRKGNQYTTRAIFNNLRAIAAKLGVTPESGGFHRNNRAETSGFMNTPDGVDEELPFAEAPSTSNMEDLLN